MRRTIPVLVVVGLAVVVALLLINRDGDAPSDTLANATTTTTSVVTTTVPGPTTTTTGTSTTAANEVEVVETVEEAEAIVANHYYAWFLGIYEQDEARIRQTVILESQVESAVAQFGEMEFDGAPTLDGFQFANTEILKSTADCLAVWTEISASFRAGNAPGVVIFRWVDERWKFLSSWQSRDDLWEPDCDSSL